MNIHGNEFEMGAGDFTLELKIDQALDTIDPGSVSYVRTHTQSGIKHIVIKDRKYKTLFTIDTGEKVISFEDVWPEIKLRVIFS
jgi:fibronectin type 3 domain-containing protein